MITRQIMQHPITGIIQFPIEEPKYWIPLKDKVNPRRAGLQLDAGTHARNSVATYEDPDNSAQVTDATTNIPRFESVGGHRAILLEPAGTNNLLYARDLTQGDWAETNVTTALDQVGETGAANSASSLLATAANGTVLQTLVLADTDYAYSVSIKRITGTGNIEVTDDNEGTWTDIKANLSTTAWYRHTITRSQANPVCGIRIVTDTEKIAVDYNQLEAGKVGSSRILTTTGAATRATESGYPRWTLPTGLFDAQGACSVWVRFGYDWDDVLAGSEPAVVSCRDHNWTVLYLNDTGGGQVRSFDGTNIPDIQLATTPANTWYKFVVRWSSTTLKMRVGVDIGAGIVWGTERPFDGSYTLGTHLRLGWGLLGRMWMRELMFWDRVLSDGEINTTESP